MQWKGADAMVSMLETVVLPIFLLFCFIYTFVKGFFDILNRFLYIYLLRIIIHLFTAILAVKVLKKRWQHIFDSEQ